MLSNWHFRHKYGQQLQSLCYISRKGGGERYYILMEDYEKIYIYIFSLEHATK